MAASVNGGSELPIIATLWTEFGALSTIVKVAERLPGASGAKVMPISQEEPGG